MNSADSRHRRRENPDRGMSATSISATFPGATRNNPIASPAERFGGYLVDEAAADVPLCHCSRLAAVSVRDIGLC